MEVTFDVCATLVLKSSWLEENIFKLLASEIEVHVIVNMCQCDYCKQILFIIKET